MCESKMEKNPTWNPLTLDVFVKFLYKIICLFALFCFLLYVLCNYFYSHLSFFQREIFNSADIAVRLYRETTPEALKIAPGIWDIVPAWLIRQKISHFVRCRNM